MTLKPTCGSPAAKKLGCTCETGKPFNDGENQRVFVPLSCPVHSPFYKQPQEVTE
jgi:hypothetical protein